MLTVNFYDKIDDYLLKYAVIIARSHGRWVLCKHKKRDTLEFPGGHREAGEDIESAARRELWEETGATAFRLQKVCAYGVCEDGGETCGMLYSAEVDAFGPLPPLEIESVRLLEELPTNWTYPLIQPKLLEKLYAQGGG